MSTVLSADLVRGKPVMKSIPICSHFQSGTGNGWSNPAGFWCSAFTRLHTSHLAMLQRQLIVWSISFLEWSFATGVPHHISYYGSNSIEKSWSTHVLFSSFVKKNPKWLLWSKIQLWFVVALSKRKNYMPFVNFHENRSSHYFKIGRASCRERVYVLV